MSVMETVPVEAAPSRAPLRDFRAALRRQPLMAVGLGIIIVLVLIAVFAPLIAPHPSDAGNVTHPTETLLSPGGSHLLGTDQLGRDVLTRVLYGARTSLLIANPYFVPDAVAVQTLIEARQRGVDVQVVLPGHCVADIVELPRLDLASLRSVPGLGECRITRYAKLLEDSLGPRWA